LLEMPGTLCVAGNMLDVAFQEAKLIAEDILAHDALLDLEIKPLIEVEWAEYLNQQKRTLLGRAFMHDDNVLITHSVHGYIGGTEALVAWAKKKYQFADPRSSESASELRAQLQQIADDEFGLYVNNSYNQFAFFDFQIGAQANDQDDKKNRVVFELYSRRLPKTCANFLALCQGEHKSESAGKALAYQGTPLHRIVQNGWLQGGDVLNGRGDGGESIYGPTFADESFVIQHDRPGILAMANKGPHTNASQFFISLCEFPAFQGKKVAFGRVVSGMAVLQRINAVPTRNQRPVEPVTVAACGEFKPVVSSDEAVRQWTRLTRRTERKEPAPASTSAAAQGNGRKATVVVLGLDNAGKSTVINHFAGSPSDPVLPTCGFEFSRAECDGWKLQVQGLGGDDNFRGLWPHYFDGAHAVVYVLDASDSERFELMAQAFQDVVHAPKMQDKPVVVLANKQDLPNALSATDIAMKLQIDSGALPCPAKVFRTIALCEEEKRQVPDTNIPQALAWLLSQLSTRFESINERVERDLALQQQEAKAKMEAKSKAQQEERERAAAQQQPE